MCRKNKRKRKKERGTEEVREVNIVTRIFEYLRTFGNEHKDENQPDSSKCFIAYPSDNWFLYDNYEPSEKKIDENAN